MKVSASQIDLFRLCERKWYYVKCMGFEQPDTSATSRGKLIHSELEKYVSTGTVPQNAVARKALHLIPQGVKLVEHKFEFQFGGYIFNGFIDLLVFNNEIEAIDYKSRSNLKYAKTEYELITDTQAVIYSYYVSALLCINKIAFSHINLPTSTQQSTKITVTFEFDKLTYSFVNLLDTVNRMYAVKNKLVQPTFNLRACSAYGGCHMEARCKLVDGVYG